MDKNTIVRFDWVMKRMLRDKANFGVLEGLLTVLMGEPIKIVELLESESNQLEENSKFNWVDIKALDSKGEIIIFEIQNTREFYFLERILYGVSKAITEHISLGDKYDKVKKVISVSILYFDLGQGSDYVYHGQTHFVGIHTHDELRIAQRYRDAILPYRINKIFPEYYLLRVNNFNEVARTPLEQWMEYLKTGDISQSATAPGLAEARERLRYFNMSEKERRAYEGHLNDIMIENDVMETSREEGLAQGLAQGREEGLAQGRAEGLTQGREEGEMKTARTIALKMKTKGTPMDEIADLTGLSLEDIKKL